MPKWIPHKCRRCGVERAPGVHVSRRGLCTACAIANVVESVAEAQANGSIGGKVAGKGRPKVKPSPELRRVGGSDQ